MWRPSSEVAAARARGLQASESFTTQQHRLRLAPSLACLRRRRLGLPLRDRSQPRRRRALRFFVVPLDVPRRGLVHNGLLRWVSVLLCAFRSSVCSPSSVPGWSALAWEVVLNGVVHAQVCHLAESWLDAPFPHLVEYGIERITNLNDIGITTWIPKYPFVLKCPFPYFMVKFHPPMMHNLIEHHMNMHKNI